MTSFDVSTGEETGAYDVADRLDSGEEPALRPLRPIDWALFGTLIPIWTLCLALHVGLGSRIRFPSANLPVAISSAANTESYPTVLWSRTKGLEVHDLLTQVAGSHLRGASAAKAYALAFDHARASQRIPIVIQRAGHSSTVALTLHPDPLWWRLIPYSFGIVVFGVVAFFRVPERWLARTLFLTAVSHGIAFIPFWGSGILQTYWGFAVSTVAVPLAVAFGLRGASLFPEGRIHAWWERVVPWIFAAGFALLIASYLWIPPVLGPEWSRSIMGLVLILYFLLVLLVLTRNYRRSDAAGRRQIRWILLGFYVGLTPILLSVVSGHLDWLPAWRPLIFTGAYFAMAAIPIGFLISLLGYRYLDVDPLISSAVSYSLLAVVLLGGLVSFIPRLAAATSGVSGISASSVQMILSLGLAGITIPLYRSLRPRIDRIFFPERSALEAGIEQLLEELSTCEDSRELIALAGSQLDALVRPETCVVYARAGQTFEPVFARGKAVPPAFSGDSPLIATLKERSAPLAADRLARRDQIRELSPFERAALETLDVAVMVPARNRGALVAFLCLGPKRSGDIYTGTDLALLAAVVSKVSTELSRFDEAEIALEAREMQAELRRYVPAAVAARLEAGEDLDPHEQAVSVLFVDIRGYTAYAESRKARDVFSTVNRYTTTVSSIVDKFDGSVVEFNGDGMMAVFGAPTPLPGKERAAVSAGREILAAVRSVASADVQAEGISVGVGIATGAAFVGSIQSVDRLIWTALGNPSNLAARLQSLTRDLDVGMVIDLATWRAAGDSASDLERREQVPIRGRSHREDVYVLPVESSPAARAPSDR